MKKITIGTKRIVNAIESISNIINNVFSEHNNNIIASDRLSRKLEKRISLLDRGFIIDRNTPISLINKAMEVTKSDPHADPGMDDQLKKIGKFIIRRSLLPTRHNGLRKTLEKVFAEKLIDSRRAHDHERDHHMRTVARELLKLFSYINPSPISPEEDIKELKQKTGIRKRLTFKKAKD